MYQHISALILLSTLTSALPPIPYPNFCDEMKDRTFRVTSVTKDGTGSITQTHQVAIEHNFDPGNAIDGPSISSCTFGRWGSGCTWQSVGTSDLGNSQVEHPMYEAHSKVDLPVNISGYNCHNQELLCTAETSAIYDPASETLFYTADTKCGATAPVVVSNSADDLATYNAILLDTGACNPCNYMYSTASAPGTTPVETPIPSMKV